MDATEELAEVGTQNHPTHPIRQLWAGWIASGIPVAMMLFAALQKVTRQTPMVAQFTGGIGFPYEDLTAIGLLEIGCAAVYVIPQTAVLGAILMTAFLGGAVAAHVRVHEGVVVPVILGVLTWLGLVLRDDRVRALLPLRKPMHPHG